MAHAPLQKVQEEEMLRVPVMWFPRPGYVSGPMGGMPIEGEENYFRGGPYPMYPGAPYGVAPVYPPFQPVVYTTQTSSTPPGKRFVNGVPVGNQKTGIPSERPDFLPGPMNFIPGQRVVIPPGTMVPQQPFFQGQYTGVEGYIPQHPVYFEQRSPVNSKQNMHLPKEEMNPLHQSNESEEQS